MNRRWARYIGPCRGLVSFVICQYRLVLRFRKSTLRLPRRFLPLLSPLLQGLFEALGCLFKAFDALVRGVLYYLKRLLISCQRSAEETQVALSNFRVNVLFLSLLFPLLEHRTRTLRVVSKQRHSTLKNVLGVFQIALLGGRKTLCQCLAGLAKSFDRGFIYFLALFVRHVFAPFCFPVNIGDHLRSDRRIDAFPHILLSIRESISHLRHKKDGFYSAGVPRGLAGPLEPLLNRIFMDCGQGFCSLRNKTLPTRITL